MKKTLLAAILALALLLCLTGCSAMTPAKNMKNTIDAVLALDNFGLSVEADASFTADGTPMSVSAEGEGSVALRPLSAGLEAEIDLGRLGGVGSKLFFNNGQLRFSVELGGVNTWYGLVLGQPVIPAALDSKASLALGVVLAEYLKPTGTQTLDGQECSVYHFVLDETTLKVALAATGELTDEQKSELIRWLNGTSGDIWIDNASFLPVQLKADCSNMGALAFAQLMGFMGGEVQAQDMKLMVTLELSDFDEADAIEFPA